MKIVAAVVSASLTLGAGAATAAPSTPITVADAWSRPTPRGLPTGVVYLSIVNHGRTPDRLTGASTAVAEQMTLHRSSMHAGVMSMNPVPGGLAIPAGGAVQIAPGGYHFMLIGLKTGLNPGQRFPATLRFQHAGAVRVEVQVRAGPPAVAGMAMP